jgi:hypothetical protein
MSVTENVKLGYIGCGAQGPVTGPDGNVRKGDFSNTAHPSGARPLRMERHDRGRFSDATSYL